MTPQLGYTRTPNAVYDAWENGSITLEQFHIFVYCYWKADRPEYIVRSYSAAQVCRFWRVVDTPANVKRYVRAAADLLGRGFIRRDYYKINPMTHTTRPYNVWVAAPETNSLSITDIRSNGVRDNVLNGVGVNQSDTNTYQKSACDNVSNGVCTNVHYQPKESNPIERDLPNPPEGGLLPLPSPFGRDAHAPQGSGNTDTNTQNVGQEKRRLNESQCKSLNALTLRYVAFTDWLWGFTPNDENVRKLLRDFRPEELLYIQVQKFVAMEKFSTNKAAHFFAEGARPLIENARLNKTSLIKPDPLYWTCLVHKYSEIQKRWQQVIDGPKAEEQKS
jgi:hypothetical protein